MLRTVRVIRHWFDCGPIFNSQYYGVVRVVPLVEPSGARGYAVMRLEDGTVLSERSADAKDWRWNISLENLSSPVVMDEFHRVVRVADMLIQDYGWRPVKRGCITGHMAFTAIRVGKHGMFDVGPLQMDGCSGFGIERGGYLLAWTLTDAGAENPVYSPIQCHISGEEGEEMKAAIELMKAEGESSPSMTHMSDFGRRLWALRESSGAKLLSVDEILEKVARRRGGCDDVTTASAKEENHGT